MKRKHFLRTPFLGIFVLLAAVLFILTTTRYGMSEGIYAAGGSNVTVTLDKTINGVPVMSWYQNNMADFYDPGEFEAALAGISFGLYAADFGLGGVIGTSLATSTLHDGRIIFPNVTPGRWYAVVQTLEGKAAEIFYDVDPLYIYVGPYGVMSSLHEANTEGHYTVQHVGGYALGLTMVFDNGESYQGQKPDGSGQVFTTERFDTKLPDGSWAMSFCADLGAHNVWGNYIFDKLNHGFDDSEMMFLIAVFDYIDNFEGTNKLDTSNGKALAQVVLWNLILKVDGNAGYADAWYRMIYPDCDNDIKVAKIEGTDDWYGPYRSMVDEMVADPQKYVQIYLDKINAPMANPNQRFVAGAIFVEGDGSYVPIDQQRQLLVLFGTCVVFDGKYKPSAPPVIITGQKSIELEGTDSHPDADFTFRVLQVASMGSEDVIPGGREYTTTINGEGPFSVAVGGLKEGTYVFMVSEEITNPDDRWLYDQHRYWVQITVTDNGNNTASAAITGTGGSSVFVNRYIDVKIPGVTSFFINGEKIIDGLYAGPIPMFSFNAVQVAGMENDTEITDGLTGMGTVSGAGDFTVAINGLTEGIYYFKITESTADMPGWTHSVQEYRIEVTVTDNGDGTATAVLTDKNDDVIFVNRYDLASVSVDIPLRKEIVGTPAVIPTFEFNAVQVKAMGSETPVESGLSGTTYIVGASDGFSITIDDLNAAESPYYFMITEADENGGGWIYDNHLYWVQVNVTDNGDGTAFAEITGTSGDEVFVNYYNVPVTTVTLTGNKQIDGDYAGEAKVFTFHAVQVDAINSRNETAGGYNGMGTVEITAETDKPYAINISGLTEGIYYFMVTEADGDGDSAWVYSSNVYWAEVTVIKNGSGLKADITNVSGDPDFINTYTVATTSISIPVTKIIEGGNPPETNFTFNAKQVDAMGSETVIDGLSGTVVTQGGDFTIEIDDLSVGIHIFLVTEEGTDNFMWTCDDRKYWVQVVVTDNGDGTSSAIIAGESGIPEFVNRYEFVPGTASAVITGNKEIIGDYNGPPKEFAFRAVQVIAMDSHEEVPDGRTAVGIVSVTKESVKPFAIVIDSLTDGEYYFKITEENGDGNGWIYDSAAYWVHINATDLGDGTVEIITTGNPTFVNRYSPAPASVDIAGDKFITVLDGETYKEDSFTFHAVQVDALGSSVLMGDRVGSQTITSNGVFQIPYKITIDGLTVEGSPYYFMVTEEEGTDTDHWVYDNNRYWVMVEVADNGDGTSQAVVTGSRIPNFTNSFTGTKASIDIPLIKRVTADAETLGAVFQFNAVQVREMGSRETVPGGFRETMEIDTWSDGDTGFAVRIVGLFAIPGEAVSYYYFMITESDTNVPGWTYSTDSYWVAVAVTDDGNGGTIAQIAETDGSGIFENLYTSPNAVVNEEEQPPVILPPEVLPPVILPPEEPLPVIPPPEELPPVIPPPEELPPVIPPPEELPPVISPPEDLPPHIIFPAGLTPEDFPTIDFYATQPDPNTPGGSVPNIPPVPSVPGNTLVPMPIVLEEEEEIVFVELDDGDVPLGMWRWDDEEFWFLDDWDIPLSDWQNAMPSTGELTLYQVLFLTGLLFILLGVLSKCVSRLRSQRR
ncbi:MAG: hypothetical protein FWE90_04100 [Defluviitaleaceae bacterium]|nr:hypothetical protein [Defluviitaleaceae bacterium]